MAASYEHSLLDKFAPQLSRHLFLPLIEFEVDRAKETGDAQAYKDILQAKINLLLNHTNMFDYVAGLHCELHGVENPPAEYAEKRQNVIAQLDKFEQETETLNELLQRDDVVNSLRSDKVANLAYLEKEHGVTVDMVNALFYFGQFRFRCGSYLEAAELLYKFRVLSTDEEKVGKATWGKLASEILDTHWEGAREEMLRVKDWIETKLYGNPRAQLDQRTMLIHWILFLPFNDIESRDPVLELLFSSNYINTIQTSCPWVLRYVAAAVILGRTQQRNSSVQQKQLKDLVRYIRQERYEYSDPITEFIAALYIDFEFDTARDALAKAETLCRNDFFLVESTNDFVEAARHLICESYFKVSNRVLIGDLSEKLGLPADAGEKWLVQLIHENRIDAKIDAQDGTITINQPQNNVHQMVVEKTKGVFFRTTVMTSVLSK